MSTLEEITQTAKRLRLCKRSVKFRPQLIYLVETIAGYVHPNRSGYISGQTAWLNPSLWFACHKDAKDYAAEYPKEQKAKVIKLNILALREPIAKATNG